MGIVSIPVPEVLVESMGSTIIKWIGIMPALHRPRGFVRAIVGPKNKWEVGAIPAMPASPRPRPRQGPTLKEGIMPSYPSSPQCLVPFPRPQKSAADRLKTPQMAAIFRRSRGDKPQSNSNGEGGGASGKAL